MFTTRYDSPKGPVISPAPGADGLLICCHGIYGGPGIALRHAAAIERTARFAEVGVCCLKGHPGLAEAVEGMRSARVQLVPLFMAEGYALGTLLPRALAGISTRGKRIDLCQPVGANPRLAQILSRGAALACRERGWRVRDTAFVIMGHGTPRDPASGATALAHARAIARDGEFAAVGVAFLDQAPSLAAAMARMDAGRTVVAGLFADAGPHGGIDVPRLIREVDGSAAYAGPVGRAPEIPDLILEQAAAELAQVS